MTNKSAGEEAFAQTFQFFQFVPASAQEELRDFLYKFAHNYDEAKEHLRLLEQVDAIDFDVKSELLFRIQVMAIQCFALAMRRMTDNCGDRSLQRLVAKFIAVESRDNELQHIRDIHNHYSFYLNKGVAHQDKPSTKDTLSAFPNNDVIEADMEYLKQLYSRIVSTVCSKYIGIDSKPHDYDPALRKLIIS